MPVFTERDRRTSTLYMPPRQVFKKTTLDTEILIAEFKYLERPLMSSDKQY
jgi:hypothetical protein